MIATISSFHAVSRKRIVSGFIATPAHSCVPLSLPPDNRCGRSGGARSRRDGARLLERARLAGTISGVLDVVLALAELDCVDEASEMTACVVDASFLGVAHPVLDLGVVSPVVV